MSIVAEGGGFAQSKARNKGRRPYLLSNDAISSTRSCEAQLITAEHAAEQGHNVLAVPGPADAESSAGCNRWSAMGRCCAAASRTCWRELDGVSALVAQEEAVQKGAAGPPPGLDKAQRRVWDFLAGGPRSVDEMAQRLALGVAQLTTPLMMLEMKKVVRRLPGSRYERG